MEETDKGLGRMRIVRSHGLVWHVDEREAVSLREWLDRHFPIRRDSAVRFLQAAPNRFVAAADGWVLKESGPRPGRSLLSYGLRPSTGALTVHLSKVLLARDIPTHRPIAWAVKRSGLLRERDYVITEEIRDAEVLTHRLDRLRRDAGGRAEVLRAWGGLVALLHGKGFSNRDLKDANILCSRGSPLKMWVTDLEGLRRYLFLPSFVAAGDLGPVALSLRCHGWLREPADAEAFFEAYNAGVPPRLHRRTFPSAHRADSSSE